jgi:phosphate transport system permease protein
MSKLFERMALALPVLLMVGILVLLTQRGWDRLSLSFLVDAPSELGRAGGLGPVLLNTFLIVGAALVLAFVFSLSTALAYAMAAVSPERPISPWLHMGLRLVEVGLCMPRLLWGLSGAAIFCSALGMGVSAAAGVLTLAAVLCPILITGFSEGLQQAAKPLAPTCRALGLSEATLWWRVVLPRARASISAACLLAAGRAFGDAAALLLTAGVGHRLISSTAEPASTLAVHIYVLVELGGGSDTVMACALVLLLLSAAIQWPLVLAGSRQGR